MAEQVPAWAQEPEAPAWAADTPEAPVNAQEGPYSASFMPSSVMTPGEEKQSARDVGNMDFFQDPGKYLWRQTPEAKDVAEGVRSTIGGLVPQSPMDVARFATPAVGGVEEVAKAADAVRKLYGGESMDQVNREVNPEAYRYENFGQKPLKQQVQTVGGDLAQVITGALIGKGLMHGGASVEAENPPIQEAKPTMADEIARQNGADAPSPPVQGTPEFARVQPAPPEATQVSPEQPQPSVPAPEPDLAQGMEQLRLDRIANSLREGRQAQEIPEPLSDITEKPVKAEPTTDQFGSETTPVSAALINDVGGVLSKSQAARTGKLKGNPALWDDAPKLSHPTHGKIYSTSGEMPDVAAQALYDAGLIPEPTVTEMWDAVKQESASSRAGVKSGIAQAKHFAELENQRRTGKIPKETEAELAPPQQDVPEGTFDTLREQPTVPTPDEQTGQIAKAAPTEIGAGDQPARSTYAPDEQPASVGQPGTGEVVAGERPDTGISTKNEYTDAKREELGFPEAVQAARRDFGTVWQEAEETARRDPGAGLRLVGEINDGKTKAISDHDRSLILREQIKAQAERRDAAEAVNNAATVADRTAAKARLSAANDGLEAIYDANRKSGRAQGQGLNAIKMLAKEDYSLEAMRSRKRAANNGTLSKEQIAHTESLQAKIAEQSDRIDRLQSMGRDVSREATAARKSGKRLTDYTGEAAAKARERINRQLHGLGARPAPPTLLYDYAVVGADHIARGLTKFSDWSAQMIKDFGEKVRPHLADLWKRASAIHSSAAKSFRSPEEVRLEQAKTRMAKDTVGYTAKIERGDFTKQPRQPIKFDPAGYKMKANLEQLKNEFERGVAKDTYRNMSKGDKFWEHFVGIERNVMKLSSPAVFEKLGVAAAVREGLASLESAGGYVASKVFPRLAKGTRYGADLKTITRAEIKAKASLFTQGMKDSWENFKGKETELEAMSGKYSKEPDFWYKRIGKFHAAIKAPIKRAEFTRSLELKMDAAAKAGEDINHPEVMDRLATESVLEGERAIFQQNTVVSKFFSMLDKASPASSRVARFLFPVVKIPVNLFKELLTYNVGAPVALARIGRAYMKGVETLEPAAREAIIRQLVKGSVGGAALLWGYFNSDKIHDLFKLTGNTLQHTPFAMALHEGSLIKQLEEQGQGTKYKPTQAWKDASFAAKTDIPFAYTVTGLTDTLEPGGWAKYLYNMIQSTVVPQASSFVAKELDKPTPFNPADRPAFRTPQNPWQAIEAGIPVLRENVPTKSYGKKKSTGDAWDKAHAGGH